jgi:tetratricopeptide (TPR) repeat protein
VQPDWSWFGANQLVSYLAVFAGAAALGRIMPGRWPALVGGVAAGVAALCGYAMLSKVFPATLGAGNPFGRLQEPFGYWNATGGAAALGLVPALWVATRRATPLVLRAAAVPAMTLMMSVVVLSFSRTALLAAIIGLAVWFAFVPGRLRSAVMLGVPAVGAIAILLVALHSHDLTGDKVALAAQDRAGHSFGIVLLAVLVVTTLAGVAGVIGSDRVTLSARVRRRIGTALIAGVALVPVVVVAGLAFSDRGLFGQISHAWQSLTSPNSVVKDNPGRLTQLGSSRPMYWGQGLDVGAHALLKGVGELGFGIARLRYTASRYKADQAHSYVVQTFADLGIAGILLTLAVLGTWARAAGRALALRRRWQELTRAQAAERQGLVAMAIVVLVYGVQSCLDFTFYFPGLTIPVLLCAGWLAGRGPLQAPVGRRREGRISVLTRPGAGALVTALATVALVGGWLMWQPLRSAQALNAAVEHPETAFASAHAAASRDPLSIDPLYLLSVLYQDRHDRGRARAQLVKATQIQPENATSWVWLGQFDYASGDLQEAIDDMSRAVILDLPANSNYFTAHDTIILARARLAQDQAAALAAKRHAKK